MRGYPLLLRLALVLLLVTLPVVGCGSGSDTGPDGPGDPTGPGFEGPYAFLLVEWVAADEYLRSTIGTLTPDGAGGLTVEAIRSTQAGTAKTAAITPLTYVEVGPGRIVITDRTGREFTADVSADRSLLAATTREGSVQPALLVLMRRASVVTMPRLADDWVEVGCGRTRITDPPVTEEGGYAIMLEEELTATGDITILGGHWLEIEEYVFLPAGSTATSSLEVQPGGLAVWSRAFDGLATHNGYVSTDLNLLMFGGEYASTATGGMFFARQGLGTEPSDLTGRYWASGMGSSTLGQHVRWAVMDFAATGGGGGTGSSTHHHNVGGIPFGPATEAFTWELATDGRIEVRWADEDLPLHGVVGPGGDFVILAGGYENGAAAEFHLLVR